MNRRTLLSLTPSLLLPRQALSNSQQGNRRKFLFVFCPGGWDQCMLFAPLFDSSFVDMESQADIGETQGIRFVDSASRPAVRSFFETYGHRTCMINGFEARSIAHDVCLRLMTTGTPQSNHDDWASIISAHSSESILMPSVHLSGPSFTHHYGYVRTQLGRNGQMNRLLSEQGPFEDLENQWLSRLLQDAPEEHPFVQQAISLESNLQSLEDISISLTPAESFSNALTMSTELFVQNLSRTVLLSYHGVRDLGWDTHAGNHMQGWHFEELFSILSDFVGVVDTTIQADGTPLSEDLCIVILSEMGRFPKLNFRDGKDHWTFTSCILFGSGVQGGQTIGAFDDFSLGRPISLSTGEATASGTSLQCSHIGATLLSLADIDPFEFGSSAPILAALQ